MRQDRYHIPMEDLSPFPMERSEDLEDWEAVVHADLESALDAEPEEKTRTFIEVVRAFTTLSLLSSSLLECVYVEAATSM